MLKSKLIQASSFDTMNHTFHGSQKLNVLANFTSIIDFLNMFKLVSTICAAHHRFVSNRVACLTHISKCVSVQFFPLLKSSVFYSLALKKGSNNFASGSSFCSRRFVLSFLVGSLFFTHGYIVFYLFLESVSTVSYSRYYITLVIMQYTD